jgi:hemerythrin-like domain-containing protein
MDGNHDNPLARLLDEEHRASLALAERVERALQRGDEAQWPALAAAFARQIGAEIERHFVFEEEQLFPRLVQAGDAGIADLLQGEHDDMREVAAELLPLLAAGGPIGGPLRALALEYVERLVSHIQKETMGLLPLVEDLLDEETARELALAYADT